MNETQKNMETLSDTFSKLQADMNVKIQNMQALEAQREENQRVKAEFERLDADARVYKLVGPVLLKQPKSEAESTVEGRLQFINGNIKDTELAIADTKEQSEKIRAQLFQYQSQVQQQAPAAAPTPQAVSMVQAG